MKQILNYKFYETKDGWIKLVEPNGNTRLITRVYAVQLYNELKQKKEAQKAKSGAVFAIITKFALSGGYDNCRECEITTVKSAYVNMVGLTTMNHADEIIGALMQLANNQSYTPCDIVVILSKRKWAAEELNKLNYYNEFDGFGDSALATGNIMTSIKKQLYRDLPTFRYKESGWHQWSDDCHKEAYIDLKKKIHSMLNK